MAPPHTGLQRPAWIVASRCGPRFLRARTSCSLLYLYSMYGSTSSDHGSVARVRLWSRDPY
jgi:hypothetical protein|eukprot:COSAG01_NODE_3949_length_5502_cov_53.650750_2_plen_61_part_00